jgi:DNA-directed RNA polymerase subunit K/omega
MRKDSRGSQIDTEKVIRTTGHGRFDMIIQATQRAREIKQQNRHSTKIEHIHGTVTALLEIQSGKVDQDYALKIK